MVYPKQRLAHLFLLVMLLATLLSSGWWATGSSGATTSSASGSYIVQAESADAAAAAVLQAGGQLNGRLAIIDGVAAGLTPGAVARLQSLPNVRVQRDIGLSVAKTTPETYNKHESGLLYPAAATGVTELHREKVATRRTSCSSAGVSQRPGVEHRRLQGAGVTIAVIDTGMIGLSRTSEWRQDSASGTLFAERGGRCVLYRDFLPRTTQNGNTGFQALNSVDQHGHGTHVISTIVDGRSERQGSYHKTPVGVAPEANLLVARALNANGEGQYSTVIAAIEWVVANRERFNVRVLNLSLYAPVNGPYWSDPLNQAVMRAWQEGIVVVTAAGNQGPNAATITVPGNVPYVITAGAIKSGRYTETGYDELARYSSRGPTETAFVKPDVLVPATRTIAAMPAGSTLANQFPAARVNVRGTAEYAFGSPNRNHAYYQLSGTSMASAQISGLVALMLQARPDLSNNQVKYRLMQTATQALDPANNEPAYSPWEQGSGRINADEAVFTSEAGAANQEMDIALDLDTTSEQQTHYWGYTTWNAETGEFVLINPNTGQPIAVWDGGYPLWAGGYPLWAGGYPLWAGGYPLWAGGYSLWAGGSQVWTDGYSLWAGGYSLWAGGYPLWAGSTPSESLAVMTSVDVVQD